MFLLELKPLPDTLGEEGRDCSGGCVLVLRCRGLSGAIVPPVLRLNIHDALTPNIPRKFHQLSLNQT